VPALTMFGRSSAKPIKVEVFAKTDLGRTRDHNEDRFLVADLSRREASLLPAVRTHEIGERGSLFVVADGMGGAAAGELASQMATDTIYQQLVRGWGTEREVTAQRFAYRLKEAVEVANEQIHAYAATHPEVRGMGTTTTAVGVLADHFFLTQVGDSRAYLIRNGEAVQLTRAQSLMQRLVEAGRAGQNQGRAGPVRRRRSAAAGAQRGDGSSGVSTHRHRDEHGAGPRLPREPRARAGGAESPSRDHAARPRRGRRRGALPDQPEPVSAQFTFLSGARVGQVETFRKAYIGLGRHPLSDVRCDAERDLDVSSRHAGIVRHNDTFVLRDLGSTNGTFVNGAPISGDVVLADGDVIGLGQNGPAVEFRILPGEPAVDTVRDALRQSQTEVARLRTELAAAGTSGNAAAIARLRAALDAAETRQRGLAGAVVMDYRTISLKNQDAVALLVVQLSDSEIFSGTAFAADSQGTLGTNRHIR